MRSIKTFVSNKLCHAIFEDARRHRIFNEADLQARVSHHLQKGYVEKSSCLYLLNEPHVAIGKGRGTVRAKPDIMLCDFDGGPLPLAAFELKCYLEDADIKVPTIARSIIEDIENLRKTQQRFKTLKNVFSIALLDIEDTEQFDILWREFRRNTDDWQKHFLKVHLINMRSEIQRGYDIWAEEWNARRLGQYRGASKPEMKEGRGLKQAITDLVQW